MATLVWDEIGKRVYESGVNKGVLYMPDGFGVPWNGLISVSEKHGSAVEPLYYDGVKFEDIVTTGEYSATIKAFTYPDEFLEFEGIEEYDKGIFVNDQKQGRFNLSYQTRQRNDTDKEAYKIHLLYNLTAIPSDVEYQTLSNEGSAIEFEWDITAIPNYIEGFNPTAHLIIDSRKMDPYLLQDVEDILYGSETNDPYLPPSNDLINYIKKWERIIIIDNGDGTWTATTTQEGYIVMLDGITFQINNANAVYLDPTEYQISSSPANEEDIWPQ
jgi:hypothetical protein